MKTIPETFKVIFTQEELCLIIDALKGEMEYNDEPLKIKSIIIEIEELLK